MGDTAVEQVRDIQAQVVHLEERLQQARSSPELVIICQVCETPTACYMCPHTASMVNCPNVQT